MGRCNKILLDPAGDSRCGLPKDHQDTGVPQRACLPLSECLPPVWLADDRDGREE